MYCSKCGVQNADGATQCVNCGGVLADAPQQAEVQAVSVAVAESKTSGLAIASLVMGILSLFCSIFMAIPAIICGIIALVKISKSNGQLKGNGFAVAGITVPVVVMVVILPMMLAILMPALGKVKHIAQRTVCVTNLKGLGTAMMVYANDYDDMLPTENWCDLFIEEVDVHPRSFICPESDAIEGESSYAMNKNIAGMNLGALPANIVLFFETDKGIESGPRNTSIQSRRYYEFLKEYGGCYNENAMVYKDRFNQFGGPEDLLFRHAQGNGLGCNVVFADGHTEFIIEERIVDLQWTLE